MEAISFYVAKRNKRFSEQPDPCGNAQIKKGNGIFVGYFTTQKNGRLF
jgi:hypothetical protein